MRGEARRIRGGAGYRAGLSAERLAAWWLRLKGYRILALRFRSPAGEVDVIACKRGVLVAVEVKRRPDRDAAAFALTGRQVGRIRQGVAHFQALHPRWHGRDCRIDAILVAPRRLPVHIINLQ